VLGKTGSLLVLSVFQCCKSFSYRIVTNVFAGAVLAFLSVAFGHLIHRHCMQFTWV